MFVVLFLTVSFSALAGLPVLRANEALSGEPRTLSWSASKGTVVVFLSVLCPCSNAHVPILKELAERYPQLTFVGIHSNADEPLTDVQSYFKSVNLPFPVLTDNHSEWANRLRAYRTPHAFLIDTQGEIRYRGGVTSSAEPGKDALPYLRTALQEFIAGRPVTQPQTRVLGCEIARR